MDDINAPKPRVPACMRTGMCCETILLSQSPRELRESYERWYGKRSSEGPKFDDIFLTYPMLIGRCRGRYVYTDGRIGRYVYGPCRNLDRDANGLPRLTVSPRDQCDPTTMLNFKSICLPGTKQDIEHEAHNELALVDDPLRTK